MYMVFVPFLHFIGIANISFIGLYVLSVYNGSYTVMLKTLCYLAGYFLFGVCMCKKTSYCIENTINLRYSQNMLGGNSLNTKEIYTKTIYINNKNIKSPLDNMLENINFKP